MEGGNSKLSIPTNHLPIKQSNCSTLDPSDVSSEEVSFSVEDSAMNVPSGSSTRLRDSATHRHQMSTSMTAQQDIVTLHRVNSHRTHVILRRSDNAAGQMSRAKNRTLVMTIVIVCLFLCCWTPYVVMTLW